MTKNQTFNSQCLTSIANAGQSIFEMLKRWPYLSLIYVKSVKMIFCGQPGNGRFCRRKRQFGLQRCHLSEKKGHLSSGKPYLSMRRCHLSREQRHLRIARADLSCARWCLGGAPRHFSKRLGFLSICQYCLIIVRPCSGCFGLKYPLEGIVCWGGNG